MNKNKPLALALAKPTSSLPLANQNQKPEEIIEPPSNRGSIISLATREETPAEELWAWKEALGKATAGLIVYRRDGDMQSELAEFIDVAEARIAELEPQEAVA